MLEYSDNNGLPRQSVLCIWDDPGLAPNGNWTTLLWQQFQNNNNSSEISIVKLVEQNEDDLRSKYLAWIYDLGESKIEGKRVIDHLSIRTGFSYWWTSSIAQKFNCSGTSQINNAIKALALEEFVVKHKFNDICLTTSNTLLASCIEHLCKKNSINFQFKKTKVICNRSLAKLFFDSLPGSIRALIFLLRYLVKTFPLYFVRNIKTPNVIGEVMFFDVLVHLDKKSVLAGKFRSNYWTVLIDKLQRWDIKSNWVHLFFSHPVVPSLEQANHLINTFNLSANDEQFHALLERPLKFKTLVKVIVDFLKVRRSLSRLESIREVRATGSNLDLWALHADEWKNSLCGTATMDVCLKLSLFLEVLGDLPRQRIGVYITENQPWEMALIYAWKVSGHGKLIGIPHTTVRYWDLRYFYDSRSYVRRDVNDLPLPDILGVNGPVAYKSILSSGYPSSRIVEVEALRFLHLAKPYINQNPHDLKKPLTILVCGDFLAETNLKILDWLQLAAKALPNDTLYLFKPHPAYPLKSTDYLKIELKISDDSLTDLLMKCDIAFTSNITSAAVDAYCLGVQVIQMLDGNEFNTSPLRGLGNVTYVRNSMELVLALGNAKHYKCAMAEPYFYLDESLPRWKKLLSHNNGRIPK
ncbi:MAG: hypothetical protein Q8M99_00835 [Methylotenera sp.]|nr:hypothetical protein [Methylotenera sp.]